MQTAVHAFLFAGGFAAALWILLKKILPRRCFPLHAIVVAGGSVGLGYGLTLRELFMRLGIITAHAIGLVTLLLLSCLSFAVVLRDTSGQRLSIREVTKLAVANSLVGLGLVTVLLAVAGLLLSQA